VKLTKTATETTDLLWRAYGENTLSRPRMFEWHKRFSEGREDVLDDKQPGHPILMKTDENVEKVRTLVRTDHHSGIRMMVKEFNMDNETDNFHKKVCQNGPKESTSF
jgi:hypothetical protein